jgi:hypothetical protein
MRKWHPGEWQQHAAKRATEPPATERSPEGAGEGLLSLFVTHSKRGKVCLEVSPTGRVILGGSEPRVDPLPRHLQTQWHKVTSGKESAEVRRKCTQEMNLLEKKRKKLT